MEECLICKAPLEYLETDRIMECSICHKQEASKTRCINGHYVCNECHTAGMDSITGLCLAEKSKNPVEILEKMMSMPFCHMHGPEHHVMVGAALLTAAKNAGADLDLPQALTEMMNRGKSVPGGSCGFWGACGAGISSGMFISILSQSTPLSNEPFALSHQMTSRSLARIGEIGKNTSGIIRNVRIDKEKVFTCFFYYSMANQLFRIRIGSPQNNQCIGKRCPFSKVNH